MPELSPYPIDPLASAIQSFGQFLPLVLGIKKMREQNAFRSKPLGQVLGFENVPAAGTGPITPSTTPIPTSMPSMNPLSVRPTPELMGARTIPDRPSFPSAPAPMQPLLSRSVRDMMSLKDTLGDTQLTNLLGAMGISKNQPDTMELEYDPVTGSFKVKEGLKGVSTKAANTILRQGDLKNKEDINKWREAAEARLRRGQITREEQVALRSDLGLLDLMVSPNFDLMDDTTKSFITSNAVAAINRLKQRGVTVFTGKRADATTPTGGTPAAAPKPAAAQPVPTPKPFNAEARIVELKAQHPDWTDQQIYAQVAIEEESNK